MVGRIVVFVRVARRDGGRSGRVGGEWSGRRCGCGRWCRCGCDPTGAFRVSDLRRGRGQDPIADLVAIGQQGHRRATVVHLLELQAEAAYQPAGWDAVRVAVGIGELQGYHDAAGTVRFCVRCSQAERARVRHSDTPGGGNLLGGQDDLVHVGVGGLAVHSQQGIGTEDADGVIVRWGRAGQGPDELGSFEQVPPGVEDVGIAGQQRHGQHQNQSKQDVSLLFHGCSSFSLRRNAADDLNRGNGLLSTRRRLPVWINLM